MRGSVAQVQHGRRMIGKDLLAKIPLTLGSLRARLQRCIVCRCVPFAFNDLIDEDCEMSQLDNLIALFALLVFNIGAATLSEYEKGRRPFFVTGYVIVGIVLLVPMFYIVGKTQVNSKGSRMFKYDRTTVQIGRWLLVWSLIFFCPFAVLASKGEWPGQRRSDFVVATTVFTNFADGAPCMRLKIVASPKHFGGRIPNQFALSALLNSAIYADWRVSKASWTIPSSDSLITGDDGKPQAIVEEGLVRRSQQPSDSPEPVVAEFEGLQLAETNFVIQVDLAPSGFDREAMAKVYDATNGEAAKKDLAAKWRQEYQTKYNDAKSQALTRGGVQIRLLDDPGLWGAQ